MPLKKYSIVCYRTEQENIKLNNTSTICRAVNENLIVRVGGG